MTMVVHRTGRSLSCILILAFERRITVVIEIQWFDHVSGHTPLSPSDCVCTCMRKRAYVLYLFCSVLVRVCFSLFSSSFVFIISSFSFVLSLDVLVFFFLSFFLGNNSVHFSSIHLNMLSRLSVKAMCVVSIPFVRRFSKLAFETSLMLV